MRLSLVRKWAIGGATLGELSINGEHECYTLEDVVRPDGIKIPGNTAIPAGEYAVAITWSPRFRVRMPILLGVPNFSGIRIHPGNIHADTDGCILVGTDRRDDRLLNSRMAYTDLFARLDAALKAGDSVRIDIVNAFEV